MSFAIMKCFLFLIMIQVIPCVHATNVFNPLHVLTADEREITFTQKWRQSEEEYETGERILDERDYSEWTSAIGAGIGALDGLTFRIGAEFSYSGVLRKNFDSSLPFQNQHVQYSGPRQGMGSIQYYSKDKDLAFELYVNSSLLHAKDTNASIGGTDAGMKFKYRHQIGHTDIYGELFTEVEGKKRLWRIDGDVETVDPYTKFGNNIFFRRNFEKLWVMLGGHFLLATDYITRSNNYNRTTDNGFGVGGIFELGWREVDWGVRVWHQRSSKSFNVISENINEIKEFEIEQQVSGLELSWRW